VDDLLLRGKGRDHVLSNHCCPHSVYSIALAVLYSSSPTSTQLRISCHYACTSKFNQALFASSEDCCQSAAVSHLLATHFVLTDRPPTISDIAPKKRRSMISRFAKMQAQSGPPCLPKKRQLLLTEREKELRKTLRRQLDDETRVYAAVSRIICYVSFSLMLIV
jgi:hypothetical protein